MPRFHRETFIKYSLCSVALSFMLTGCDEIEEAKRRVTTIIGGDAAPAFIEQASQNAAVSPPPLSSNDIQNMIARQVQQAMLEHAAEHNIQNLENKVEALTHQLNTTQSAPSHAVVDHAPSEPIQVPPSPVTPPQGAPMLESGFEKIATQTTPAVVNVVTTQVVDSAKMNMMDQPRVDGGPQGLPFDELFRDFFEQSERPKRVQAVGSGFIVKTTDEDAFIVTNYHVISEARKISIILFDKTELDATMHAFDERTDLAVLNVKLDQLPPEKRTLPVLEWGDSDAAKVGHFVVAIGNPFGLGSTVTSGIISGKGRDIVTRTNSKPTDLVDDFIQHDASINMGNSGGVLLNMAGQAIGVNTAIFSPSGGSIGIGFAIPASLAKPTVDQLIEFGRTKRGWLGVTVLQVSAEIAESLALGDVRGSIINSLSKDGPAFKAGLQEHDIITEIDGRILDDDVRLTRVVGEIEVGKRVKVKALRDKKEMIFDVDVGEYPSNFTLEEAKKQTLKTPVENVTEVLGMKLVEMPKNLNEDGCGAGLSDTLPPEGVLIIDVTEGSSAEDCGLRKGDIVSEINMESVQKPEMALAIIDGVKQKDPNRPSALLTVNRHGLPSQYVVIQFKSLAQLTAEQQIQERKTES